MKDINQVSILGNVGKVEVKILPSGDNLGLVSVATKERWKDKDGEWNEKTEWHRVVAFKPFSNGLDDKIWKGCRVFIQGKLVTRKYQDQSGNDRYTTEIVANLIAPQSKREQGTEAKEPAREDVRGEDYDWGAGDEIPF